MLVVCVCGVLAIELAGIMGLCLKLLLIHFLVDLVDAFTRP